MQAVNLLPAYARPSSRWASLGNDLSPKKAFTAGGVAAGVAAVALGGLYAHERSVVGGKRNALATTQARLTAVEAQAAPLKAAESQSQSELNAATAIDRARIPWETVLGGLSRVLPTQVYLTSLQASTPTPAGSAAAAPAAGTTTAPTGFSVSGVASSDVRVALVLDRLALMPWLSNVTLVSTSKNTSGTGSSAQGDQFSIQATFGPAGGGK